MRSQRGNLIYAEFHHRANINLKLREYIFSRDGYNCTYCGDFGNQIDHVVPPSKGGRNLPGNLVVSCKSCNMRKSNKVDKELVDMLVFAFRHLLEKGEDLSWMDYISEKYHG